MTFFVERGDIPGRRRGQAGPHGRLAALWSAARRAMGAQAQEAGGEAQSGHRRLAAAPFRSVTWSGHFRRRHRVKQRGRERLYCAQGIDADPGTGVTLEFEELTP